MNKYFILDISVGIEIYSRCAVTNLCCEKTGKGDSLFSSELSRCLDDGDVKKPQSYLIESVPSLSLSTLSRSAERQAGNSWLTLLEESLSSDPSRARTRNLPFQKPDSQPQV